MLCSIVRLNAALLACALGGACGAEPVGEVDTVFILIGPDHKIVVDAYDDPKGERRGVLRVAREDGRHQRRARPGGRQIGSVDRVPAGRADLSLRTPSPSRRRCSTSGSRWSSRSFA